MEKGCRQKAAHFSFVAKIMFLGNERAAKGKRIAAYTEWNDESLF